MEKYNYFDAVKESICDYINEHFTNEEKTSLEFEDIYGNMFISDTVTGNASGSYTFSRWKAEECLCHNLDLLAEAYKDFDCDCGILNDPEGCDVTIRCYLLAQCLQEVLDELKEKGE